MRSRQSRMGVLGFRPRLHRRRAALLRDFSGDGIQLASAVLLDYLAWPWSRRRQCL